ncbi:hypothetical protein PAXRUDRAFT_167609, partial [Paxillus rubicundulus Ve08.2h10]
SMACTKQTAQKATGGGGPRQQLQRKNSRAMTSKKHVMTKVEKSSGGPMVIDKDAVTMPHRSSLLTPPPPSSPMQAPSALPSSSKDDIKNEGFTFHTSSKPVLTTFPIMSSRIVMTAGSQVNCEPLLIIHFYLKGMDLQGCPPRAICEYLWLYFPPNALHFSELEFNFGTRAKIAKHKGKMETIVPSGQVVILISTHSEEERGDLFAGEEGPQTKPRPIAVKVDQVILQIGMDNLLKGAMVMLLTCRLLVKHEQSFQDLCSSICQ